MSVKNISAKCNFDSGAWTIDKKLLSHTSNQIGIGFENNVGSTIFFNNLSFSYKITDNATSSVIVEKTYPPTGITYEETDDTFIVIDALDLVPGHEYNLLLTATNNSKIYTETVKLNVPYPIKPFSSWTWSEKNRSYESPVAYPNDNGYLWDWDETNKKWVKRSGEMIRGLFMQKLHALSLDASTTALSKAEDMLTNDKYTIDARIVWQYSTIFVRNDEKFNVWANEVGLTESQLDTIFA